VLVVEDDSFTRLITAAMLKPMVREGRKEGRVIRCAYLSPSPSSFLLLLSPPSLPHSLIFPSSSFSSSLGLPPHLGQ